MKFGHFLLIFVLVFVLTLPSVAELPPYLKQSQQNSGKASQGLTIVIHGKQLPDGSYSPAKVIDIPKVDPDKYVHNAIYVKTKEYYPSNGSNLILGNAPLNSAIANLGVSNIRQPFASKPGQTVPGKHEEEVARIYEITYTIDTDPFDACRELLNNPDIEYAVPIFRRYPCDYAPNDPQIPSQWAIATLQAEKAWDITKGKAEILIAIVDTGTEWDHEDLGKNLWYNPKEIPDNGIDDDGDGKIDDYQGWDFVGNIDINKALSNKWEEDKDPRNVNQPHGTHVAGLAAATTDNYIGIASLGFNCRFMPLKCASDQIDVPGIWRGYEAIKYAADMGANIINCSWGGPSYSPAEQDIINYAVNQGSIVIVAAGNDAVNIDKGAFYPACYDNVICVGATNQTDQVASFSNTGRTVSVYTPGEHILSTVPGQKYDFMDGTSMAAPITSGIAGLVLSSHPEWLANANENALRTKRMIHQLRSTSDNVLTTADNRMFYYGRANAFAAVDYNRTDGTNTVPGIEISKVTFPSSEALTSFQPTTIKIYLTNYLGNAKDIIMKFAPLSPYLTVAQSQIVVDTLKSGVTKSFDLTVQLQSNNPWYNGNADLQVSFGNSSYMDYQLIHLPIVIPVTQTFTSLFTVPEALQLTCYQAAAPDDQSLWMVGTIGNTQTGGYIKFANNTINFMQSQSDIYNTIHAFDNNNVYIGTGSAAKVAKVIHTTDGGQHWDEVDLSGSTANIETLHFFDPQNGLYVGDPKDFKFGIGLTTDAGLTWGPTPAVPDPQANENCIVGASCWVGNNLWFGTTNGRVIKTTNRGTTWTDEYITGGTAVYLVNFRDASNGVAIYTETLNPNSTIYAASTTNGGASWASKKFNFTSQQLIPVYLYTPKDSKLVYLLCAGGEFLSSTDNGATWKNVLAQKQNGVMNGSGVVFNNNQVRLWEISQNVAYLTFTYYPGGEQRILSFTNGTSLAFDSVAIGKWWTSTVAMKNTGNAPITLLETTIIPDTVTNTQASEFTIAGTPPTTLEANIPASITIKFQPAVKGLRKAILRIKSDAATPETDVTIQGFGKEISGGVDDQTDNGLQPVLGEPSPNPTNDIITIPVTTVMPSNISVGLFNIYGEKIADAFSGLMEAGTRNLVIQASSLPSGVYFIRLNADQSTSMKKIIVTK
jgi:subtilisin family serine protease/photosystem II stability/assembly factor-like uncharacterized protein